MASSELLKAVAVTAELRGCTFSPAAARMFVDDLAGYDEAAVVRALQRCRREMRGTGLAVSDVIARLDDGRPGPEEAWAAIPRDEATTVVWTEEMAAACGVAQPLIAAGEDVPARMAFKESYTRLVALAREERSPVKWTVSLGHDRHGRERPLMEAIQLGRISADRAKALLPYDASESALAVVNELAKSLLLPK